MPKITSTESQRITELMRDPNFRLEVANLGKSPEQRYAPTDLQKIALSMPRLFAVIHSARTLLAFGRASDFKDALRTIILGDEQDVVDVSNDTAHITWLSVQPVLGGDKMERPAFSDSDGLDPVEISKDRERIVATAQFLLERF